MVERFQLNKNIHPNCCEFAISMSDCVVYHASTLFKDANISAIVIHDDSSEDSEVNVVDAGSERVEAEVDTRENNSVLTVLSMGNTIHYTIPSFPVYSAELLEVKVQWEDEDGSLLVFDAFARNCDLLDHQLLYLQ